MKYPSSWEARTDKGYLELTSPDGTVTGHVSATGTYGPGEEWFTDRNLSHRNSYPAERLTELLGTTVSLYSGFQTGQSPEHDSVAHGLTQVNASDMVSLGKTGSKEELWATFTQTGVNTTGKPLSDAQAAEAVDKAVNSDTGVTTQAILKSVEITGDAPSEPPAPADPEALTETYIAPDGRYSLKYPSSWKATTDNGYLELTSASGVFTGRVATTDVRPATEEWFTTTRTMGGDGVQSPITDQLGSPVSTYSAYVHSPESADKDLALYGLTQVNSSGMVSLLENPVRRSCGSSSPPHLPLSPTRLCPTTRRRRSCPRWTQPTRTFPRSRPSSSPSASATPRCPMVNHHVQFLDEPRSGLERTGARRPG